MSRELTVHLQSATHQTSGSSLAPEDLNRAPLSLSSTTQLCCCAGNQERQHRPCIAGRATHDLVGRSPLSPLTRKRSSEEKKGEMDKHLGLSSL